jgi:Sec-independent protein secretion pathway component TatC
MLAFPLWVLYEIGIVAAGLMIKPQPADDAAMESELEKIEAGQKKD